MRIKTHSKMKNKAQKKRFAAFSSKFGTIVFNGANERVKTRESGSAFSGTENGFSYTIQIKKS